MGCADVPQAQAFQIEILARQAISSDREPARRDPGAAKQVRQRLEGFLGAPAVRPDQDNTAFRGVEEEMGPDAGVGAEPRCQLMEGEMARSAG